MHLTGDQTIVSGPQTSLHADRRYNAHAEVYISNAGPILMRTCIYNKGDT